MEKIIMYTDGGSRGNPGPAAIGVWIETLNKEYAQTIGEATNNDAEYQALIYGLKKCKSLIGKIQAKKVEIICYLDSELIVRQLNHEYKISQENTQRYFIAVWNAMLDFARVQFVHVPRAQNAQADKLVNKALDATSASGGLL